MFRRRSTLSPLRRLADVFWPRLGWRRFASYMAHRLGRMAGSPHSIAVGLACGAAVSFTPFIGAHFVTAALMTILLRGNLLASVIGTAVGNPWTFPIIWATIYHVGNWIVPGHAPGVEGVDFVAFFAGLTGTLLTLDFSRFVDSTLPVWGPMVVGSLPISAAVWFVCYWPSRRLIQRYQDMRRKRRRRAAGPGRLPGALARRAE